MKILNQIYLIIFLLLTGCYTTFKTNGNQNKYILPIQDQSVFLPGQNYNHADFNLDHLFKTWVNSRELPDSIVWRPKNYKNYPASRFRETIIFHKDGEYEELMLSPIDAHYFQKYRWRLSKNNKNLIILFNDKGERTIAFKIKKLDAITLELNKN